MPEFLSYPKLGIGARLFGWVVRASRSFMSLAGCCATRPSRCALRDSDSARTFSGKGHKAKRGLIGPNLPPKQPLLLSRGIRYPFGKHRRHSEGSTPPSPWGWNLSFNRNLSAFKLTRAWLRTTWKKREKPPAGTSGWWAGRPFAPNQATLSAVSRDGNNASTV